MLKYCILGTDERINTLRELYIKDNVKITDIDKSNVVITAVPFSKDGITLTGENITCLELIEKLKKNNITVISGAISKEIKEKLDKEKITYFDIMQNDALAIYNAIPTVEGAISLAIENTKFTLHNSNCLVLGFGRVGKVLSNTLKGIGANVYVEARKDKDIAEIEILKYNSVRLENLENYLQDMDVIFNTIPYMILDEKRLKLVKKDTLIIDLASNPGGVDFEFAKKLDKKVIWALALPSKVAPYTSAIYMKKIIDNIIENNFDI